MAISPINFGTPPTVPNGAPAASTVPNREVATAVQTLNQNGGAGAGREFSIAIDGKTKVPIVRIIDSVTNELIEQIPSQYVLDLAQQINEETGSNPEELRR